MNIAARFLRSKKSHSIVNLVAKVSTVAIAIPVVALVLVLSLHNGLSQYVHQMYGKVDSPLRVTSPHGILFEIDSLKIACIRNQVGTVSRTLDEQVLARYGDNQTVVTLRGVDSLYDQVVDIRSVIVRGEWRTEFGGMPRAVIGAGVAYALNYGLSSGDRIDIYALGADAPTVFFLPLPLFSRDSIVGSGVFQLDKATDQSMIIAPIEFVSRIAGRGASSVTSLEIAPRADMSVEKSKKILNDILGGQFTIRDQDQQRGDIYKVMNIEKWIIMLMLGFVALIASISLSGCMVMIVSEKDAAIRELSVMGMKRRKLRGIFVRLGMMIVGIGVISGLVVGLIMVWGQSTFEILKMGGESFVMSAYPVMVQWSDILLITLSVAALGYMIVKGVVSATIKQQQDTVK